MSWKTHIATITVVAFLVMFTNLGGPRLWDRDEPRNAGCAVEMLERGDWVTPVFNGELRTHKPVLLYWFMMTAYSLLGVSEFSARVWSALLAVGTCYCTYFIGRRLFSPQVGVWSAVILATTLMFDVAGRAATPDSVLIFFCTLALTWYVANTFPQRGENETSRSRAEQPSSPVPVDGLFPASWSFALVLYGLMGVATLAKGPIGVILPTAIIGMFLLIRCAPTRYGSPSGLMRVIRPITYFLETCWRMRILSATAIVLAIALPWYIWVGVRTEGAWLQGFFVEHNLGRAMNSMEGHEGSPLLFYPVALMLGFAPWSVFFAPTLIEAWKRVRGGDGESAGLLFATCWLAVYVGLFSLASTKLPSYITPCYPGLALLVGAYVHRWSRNESLASWIWPRIALVLWGCIGITLLIALPIAASRFLPGEQWIGAIGLIPLVAAVIGLVSLRIARPDAAARAFALGAFLFVWVMFSFIAVKVDSKQRFHELLAELQTRSNSPKLAHYQTLEPSWVFYSSTAIIPAFIGDLASEHDGEHAGDVCVKHGRREARQFMNASPDHFVLMTRENYDRVQDQLPKNVDIVAEAPYFLKDTSIVAVGQTQTRVAARQEKNKPSR